MKYDKKILRELKRDARESLTAMSRKTHIPVSTIFDKMREMEKEVIIRYTPLINFDNVGYSIREYVLLSLEDKHIDIVSEFLKVHQNVNTVSIMSGDYDIFYEAAFKTMKDRQNMMKELKRYKIKEMITIPVVKDLKREELIP